MRDTFQSLKEATELMTTTKNAVKDDVERLLAKKSELQGEIDDSESKFSSARTERENKLNELNKKIEQLENQAKLEEQTNQNNNNTQPLTNGHTHSNEKHHETRHNGAERKGPVTALELDDLIESSLEDDSHDHGIKMQKVFLTFFSNK